MRIRFLLLLGALLGTGNLHARRSATLTVASYNIRYDNPNDIRDGNGWSRRREAVAGIIRSGDFDLFGIQEAFEHQVNDLLKALPGYAGIGVGRIDGQKAGEYSPVFYRKDRFELLDSGTFWLSETPELPSTGWDAALERICTWVRLRDRQSGIRLWFFNTHLDHVGERSRKESARLILQRIENMCGNDPVILTGDFNDDQNHPAYALLENSERLKDAYLAADERHAPNGTFNSFDPDRHTESRIDHVFLSSDLYAEHYDIRTDRYWQQDTAGKQIPRLPSDHYPVVVRVNLRR